MKSRIDKTKVCVTLLIAIAVMQMLSLLKLFDFRPVIAFSGIMLLIFAYDIVSISFKKMTIFFFTLGIVTNLYTNQPLQTWIDGITYMLNISSILVIMQLFTIPIKLGNYDKTLSYIILRTFKTERSLYFFTMAVTHVFSSFLLFGTIPVMISLIGEPLKKSVDNYKKFASTAITRSYSMVVMWTPGAVNILLVITATGASWSRMLPLGVILSIWGIALSYILQKNQLGRFPLQQQQGNPALDPLDVGKAWSKLFFIVAIVFFLIFLIIFIGKLQIGDNTSQVMLASLALALLWLSIFVKNAALPEALHEYLNVSLVKTLDLAVLYISLGIFSKALELSGILPLLYPVIGKLANIAGIFTLPFISLIVFFLSLIGLHPFVILVILGKMLMLLELEFSPEIIAISLVFGSSVSYMTSPFAGIVLTSAKYLDTDSYQVGLKWNGIFGLTYFTTGSLIIMLWHVVTGYK